MIQLNIKKIIYFSEKSLKKYYFLTNKQAKKGSSSDIELGDAYDSSSQC